MGGGGGGGGGFRSPQKMAKVVKKKLRKFWLRRKNKKKNKTGEEEEEEDRDHEHERFLDPTRALSLSSSSTHSQTHYHYVHSYCCEPSAPPMPPWLEMELEFNPEPDAPIVPTRASDVPSCSARMREEIIVETTTNSYQQYLDPNPVYGFPVKPTTGDFVGAQRSELLVKIISFLGCLCPCFRIGEEEEAKKSC